MTYTLTVLNKGSLATHPVVTDTVPAGVTYLRGGTLTGNTVSWVLPDLDTGAVGQSELYRLHRRCGRSAGAEQQLPGVQRRRGMQERLPVDQHRQGTRHLLLQPTWIRSLKSRAAGAEPVTPTLTLANSGPGNALDASAMLYFYRISVSLNDLVVTPASRRA